MNPVDAMKGHPGYQQYQDAAARTPLSKFPWGTVAANVAGVAGAHLVGYYTAGALANTLAHSRAGRSFAALAPATRRNILGQVIGAAGSLGAVSTGLAHMAGQVRVANELARLERERSAAGSTKVAGVYELYAAALAGR